MALKDDIKKQRADAQAKSGKPVSLLEALSQAATVFKDGLIAPNKFNAPAANRFKDSALGLIGAVPGLGVPAAAVQTADYTKRDEPVAAMLSALGAAIPALGAMMKVAAPAPSAIKNKQSGAIFGIADEILGEYPVQKGIHTALKKKAAAVGGDVTHPSVVIPDADNGVSYFLAGDGSLRVNMVPRAPHTARHPSELVDIGLYKDYGQHVKNSPVAIYNNVPGKSFTEIYENTHKFFGAPKYGQNIQVSVADARNMGISSNSVYDHELSHALSNLFGGVRGGSPKTFIQDLLDSLPANVQQAVRKTSIGINAVQDELTAATFATQEGLAPYLDDIMSGAFKGEWKAVDNKQVWSSVLKHPKAFNNTVTSILSSDPKAGSESLRNLYKIHDESYKVYKNLAGEVEARGAQKIIKLIENGEPVDKILNTNPHAYMDTPLEDVIMQYTSPLIKQVNP